MAFTFNTRYKPKTTREYTKSDLTVYDSAAGNPNALTIYGKSEVVDGAIVSAGEGWATVDLGTLNWVYRDDFEIKQFRAPFPQAEWTPDPTILQSIICPIYKNVASRDFLYNDKCICRYWFSVDGVNVIDTTCTTLTQFLNKVNGVILAYKQVTPTDNTIAVKTDNSTGIDGTMATFTTGTPLRGITGGARDVMEWDGVSGEVVKNCGEVDLGALTWNYASSAAETKLFIAPKPTNIKVPASSSAVPAIMCAEYTPKSWDELNAGADAPNGITVFVTDGSIRVVDSAYNDATTFKTAMTGVKLIYELETTTTSQFSATENASFAGLETYTPQTHITNNAGAEMKVNYTIKTPTI